MSDAEQILDDLIHQANIRLNAAKREAAGMQQSADFKQAEVEKYQAYLDGLLELTVRDPGDNQEDDE